MVSMAIARPHTQRAAILAGRGTVARLRRARDHHSAGATDTTTLAHRRLACHPHVHRFGPYSMYTTCAHETASSPQAFGLTTVVRAESWSAAA